MLVLGILIGIPILYALTTLVVLCFARIEKEPDGTPILDTNSWHFKVAYPCKRYDLLFIKDLGRGYPKVSVCGYFWRLFLMIWIGWPFWALLTLFVSTVCLIFGYVATPDFKEIDRYQVLEMNFKKIRLPRISRFRILPVYAFVLSGYVWLLCTQLRATLFRTLEILGMAVGFLTCLALVELVSWLRWTDQKKVSLVREMVRAKVNRWCPFMKVKNGTTPANPDSGWAE